MSRIDEIRRLAPGAPLSQKERETLSAFQRPTDFAEERMIEHGMEEKVYEAYCTVAEHYNCLIFIRSTNPGSVAGFNELAQGKELSTKGKSSVEAALQAFIALFSKLSKKPPEPGEWVKEQDSLLMWALLPEEGKPHPKVTFVPRILTQGKYSELRDVTTAEPAEFSPLKTSGEEGSEYPKYIVRRLDRDDLRKLEDEWRQRHEQFEVAGPRHPFKGFQGKFSLDATEEESYYPVYVRKDCVVAAAGAIEADYWSGISLGDNEPEEKASKRLQVKTAFFPESGGNNPLPLAELKLEGDRVNGYQPSERGRPYVPVCVLATEGAPESGKVPYYPYVADYDVFAICPSWQHFTEPRRKDLEWFVPKRVAERGLVSDYELAVRAALNREIAVAIRPVLPNRDQQALLKTWGYDVSGDLSRFVLPEKTIAAVQHGCEVNNYFYTETLGDLIFVRPPTSDEDRPLFTISSLRYLELADAVDSEKEKASRRSGRPETVPDPDINNQLFEQYFLPLNMRWATVWPEKLDSEQVKTRDQLPAVIRSLIPEGESLAALLESCKVKRGDKDVKVWAGESFLSRLLGHQFEAMRYSLSMRAGEEGEELFQAYAVKLGFLLKFYLEVHDKLDDEKAAELAGARTDVLRGVVAVVRGIHDAAPQMQKEQFEKPYNTLKAALKSISEEHQEKLRGVDAKVSFELTPWRKPRTKLRLKDLLARRDLDEGGGVETGLPSG